MTRILILILTTLFACKPNPPKAFEIEWIDLPQTKSSALPYLEVGLDEVLRCSWVENNGDTATLKFSEYRDGRWVAPEEIARGTDWFVNWADYPKISATKDVVIAHYLQKSAPDTYAYDVKAKIRTTSGWSDPFKVHSDTTKTEHGFVSILPLAGDKFRMVWLDGRNTSGSHTGAMSLRTAIIDGKGQISERKLIDDRVCDCCATAVTSTVTGPIVAYRDRSMEEIRDIAVSRLENKTWSSSKVVHEDLWEIAGCPVNGPSIDALDDQLVTGWFTGAQHRPSVQVSFSKDNGKSFNQPIIIDDRDPIGRVAVKMLDRNRASVVWLARDGERAQIKMKVINENGTVLKEMIIAETSAARPSGFPQLALKDDYLFIAHTVPLSAGSRVRVGKMRY